MFREDLFCSFFEKHKGVGKNILEIRFGFSECSCNCDHGRRFRRFIYISFSTDFKTETV